jgi:hypothetical protein
MGSTHSNHTPSRPLEGNDRDILDLDRQTARAPDVVDR